MKNVKKIIAMVLAFVVMVSVPLASSNELFTVEAQAAPKIKLDATNVILRTNDTVTLTLRNAKAATAWGSSNTKFAIVKKKSKYTATVTAKKAGTAVITAVSGGVSYTCKITVIKAFTWQNKTHKYQIIEKGMKWSAAKKYCESLGGHLIVVSSEKENEYLKRALKKYGKRNNYWLGAKKNSKGEFKWVNGEKFEYSDFAPGMPDNSYEKCLMIYRYDNPNTSGNDSYRWNDLVNDGTFGSEEWFGLDDFGFVCEWD